MKRTRMMIVAVMPIAVATCEREHAPPQSEATNTVVKAKEYSNHFSDNTNWAIFRFALHGIADSSRLTHVHFQYLNSFNLAEVIIPLVPRQGPHDTHGLRESRGGGNHSNLECMGGHVLPPLQRGS